MKNKGTHNLKFIYWFAYYNLESPSVRYRAKFPLDYLKDKYGLSYFFVTPSYKPRKILHFLKVYWSALFFRKRNSLIVVQRVNSNFIYSNLLKFLIKVRNSNTVYDIDDADYLEHPPATIYYFIKNCSSVSVGSKELQQKFSQLNKKVILNTSPTPDLEITKQERNGLLKIGWIGDFSGGHKEGLVKNLFPAVKKLPFKVKLTLLGVKKKVEIDFVTEYFRYITNVELEMPQDINWLDESNIHHLISKFDIGIATLLNNELHRSKSAFKLKQYLNNGVPVLSSPIPENSHFVDDGRNGFLCKTADEFTKRIIEINEMNASEYNRLSNEARSDISKFNLSKYAQTLISNCNL